MDDASLGLTPVNRTLYGLLFNAKVSAAASTTTTTPMMMYAFFDTFFRRVLTASQSFFIFSLNRGCLLHQCSRRTRRNSPRPLYPVTG